jgi:hypothetical protein
MKLKIACILFFGLIGLAGVVIVIRPSVMTQIRCRQAAAVLNQMKTENAGDLTIVQTIEDSLASLQTTPHYSPLFVEAQKTRDLARPAMLWVLAGWIEKHYLPSELLVRFGNTSGSVFAYPITYQEPHVRMYGFNYQALNVPFVTDPNLLAKIKDPDIRYVPLDCLAEDVYVLLLCQDGTHTGWFKCGEFVFNKDFQEQLNMTAL